MINVERLVIMDGFDYNQTSHNATVANGKMLEIDAGALGSGHRIQFNGSAETDGRFQFDGGGGNDGFKGGAGADIIAGNAGADRLTGGGGADTFLFNGVSDSLFAAFDAITDFKAGTDKFQLDVDVTGIDAAVSGGVSVAGDLQGLVAGHLSSHHAILVAVTGGSLGGHKLLVVDADGIAGYDAGADYVIDVTGIKGNLGTGDFLV
jgi:Ca2+-binding RTX toxin-like protein